MKVLMRALGFQVKKKDVVKMIHEIDPANEGFCDYGLYSQIMAERYAERDPEEEIMKAFQRVAASGLGARRGSESCAPSELESSTSRLSARVERG